MLKRLKVLGLNPQHFVWQAIRSAAASFAALFAVPVGQNGGRAGVVSISLSVAAVVGLNGCGYFLGSRAETPPAEFRTIGDDCFKTLKNDMVSWFQSGSPSISFSLDCGVHAMDQFAQRTTGKNPESWSKSELANFFETYFPGSNDGPQARTLIDNLLKLKQALFGGPVDRLTRAEMARLRDFAIGLKPDLEALSPHVDLVFFRSQSWASAEGSVAAEIIGRIMRRFSEEASRTERARPPYEVEALLRLAYQFGFSPGSEETPFEAWLSLAEAGKAVAAGGSSRYLIAAEWPALIDSIGRVWATAIRVRYQWILSSDPFGRDLQNVGKILSETLSILDTAIAAQGPRSKGIGADRLGALIDALEETGQLKKIGAKKRFQPQLKDDGKLEEQPRVHLTAQTLKSLLPVILGKLLHGNSRPDREEKAKGLSHSQVDVLRMALRDWLSGQKQILRAFGDQADMAPSALAQSFLLVPTGIDPSSEPAEERAARLSLSQLLSQGRPLVRDSESRLIIKPASSITSMTRSDLDLLNGLRAGISWLFRGYTYEKQPGSLSPGIKESETVEIYKDIREFGRELGLIDVRNDTAGERTFMEANLFLSVSETDGVVSLSEAIEWFQVVLGGGLLADKIHESMSQECGLDSLDIFKRAKLDLACFRKRFKRDFAELVPNLPGMVAWYQSSPEIPEEFQIALENAARSVGFVDLSQANEWEKTIDSSDIRAVIPVIHYIENLFVHYAKSDPNVLSTEELWAAFPRISSVIRKQAGEGVADEEWVQKAIFSWLITFSTIPDTGPLGKAQIGAWSLANGTWWGTADRLTLLKVVAAFGTKAREDRFKKIGETLRILGPRLKPELASGHPTLIAHLTDLMQCQEGAQEELKRVLRENIENIFAGKNPVPAAITHRIKTLIDQDPAFEPYCLRF